MFFQKEEDEMNEKNKDGIRDAKSLGRGKMFILGLQHMFAMFGATILVPILVMGYFSDACGEPITRGLTVSVTLFCAGVGTLIFHLCSKFKVPAFLGSSFAYLGGFSTIANLNSGMYANMDVNTKAAYACGGIVVAGCLYFILAAIIKLVGVNRVMKFLPPVVTGPIIICIGLSLAPSAISNASTNWLLAIIALVVIIIFNIWGKGMFKIIPILMGVVISYVCAIIFNACGMTNADGSAILDFSSVASAAFVGVPHFQLAKFDITAILVMAPIALATMMEHIGDMSAISATVGENYLESPGLHRTLIGDGLATAFAGMLGGPANTTYGENTGVLELSKVYDPAVVRLAACFAIVLSFIPKFSDIIATMPSAIIGGVSFMLYGMISAIGVRNVVENKVDLTKSRNLIIAGVIFVCGLGFSDGITFTVAGTSITLTALAIAAIAGIVLNAILPGNDYEFGKNPAGDQSRGVFVKNSDND
jgi:uracil permease